MGARIPALVEPPLLVWARERASLSLDEAAKKLALATDQLAAIEAGDAILSMAQLRKMAELYKRPISVFFLPEPPTDFQPLRDLRRLEVMPGPMSKALAYEIRAAQERRIVAIELADALGEPPPDLGLSARRTDNPEIIGASVREALGISI